MQDGKALSQRVWLLTQRQAETEHQLMVLIHTLEERAELVQAFLARAARFLTWGQDLLLRYIFTSLLLCPDLKAFWALVALWVPRYRQGCENSSLGGKRQKFNGNNNYY